MLIFPLKFEIVVIWLVLGRQLRKLIAYILSESLEIVITQDAIIETGWEWFSLFFGYVTLGIYYSILHQKVQNTYLERF